MNHWNFYKCKFVFILVSDRRFQKSNTLRIELKPFVPSPCPIPPLSNQKYEIFQQ